MNTKSRSCPHTKPRLQRGAAAIEFSILIIPLLLMLLGVTEFGRAIYQYNTLVKSVRDATRLLSTVQAGSSHATAKCLAVYGTIDCSGSPLAPGLTTGMVSVCDALNCASTHASQTTGSGTINLVTVTINDASLADNAKFHFQSQFNFALFGLTFGTPDIAFGPIQNTMRQAS